MLTNKGVPVANLMGVVSSNIFIPKDAPKYFPALITTAAFGAVGCLLTLGLGAYMIVDKKRRDQKEGRKVKAQEIPTELMADGPTNPSYRWFLQTIRGLIWTTTSSRLVHSRILIGLPLLLCKCHNYVSDTKRSFLHSPHIRPNGLTAKS